MNSRFLKSILLAAVIVGGIWVLVNRDQIEKPGDVVRLIQENLLSAQQGLGLPENGNATTGVLTDAIHSSYPSADNPWQHSPQFITNVVRIASFRLNQQITGPQDSNALEMLADICRRYDAIAFQEIASLDNGWLVNLTNTMNTMGSIGSTSQQDRRASDGKKAEYAFVSDLSNSSGLETGLAIVFNRRTLELDAPQPYTISDPDDLLSRDPLVALFRARGPLPNQAFTFTLVNVRLDSDRADSELAYLSELFRAIRNDGRGEDDVLIVGSFNGGDRDLQPMRKLAGLTWVVSNRPTDTAGRAQSDNLVFSEVSTVEFTGRGGVFDFMRYYNLRLDDAMRISDHLPVWAEFSIFEGAAAQSSLSKEDRPADNVAITR